ncbi:MAG: succinylglutamate desuccinylase/aspartoacylase family protein [Thermostichales cyanobacterium DRC_bins_46]
MLTVWQDYPPELLTLDAGDLYQVLPGPTLIHLPGRRQPPLFVSVLLHGNEVTGWLAVRKLLQTYQDRELPRSLLVLIGNVAAARYGMRRLPDQPDGCGACRINRTTTAFGCLGISRNIAWRRP